MLSFKFLGCKNPDHPNRHVNGKHLSDSEETVAFLSEFKQKIIIIQRSRQDSNLRGVTPIDF